MAAPAASTHKAMVAGTLFDVGPNYKLIRPIGQGAYGVVCSAICLKTNRPVAIKKITKPFLSYNQTKRVVREIKILRSLRHDNVIEILDLLPPPSFEEFEDLYVVTELLETDLQRIISSDQGLTETHVQVFMYQILRGLKYVHSANVLHRDIKPSNLLLNASCELKIGDFGLARVSSSVKAESFLTEYVATRWYRAPEVMLSWQTYTNAIDVWAAGCIFAELLGRRPLFPGRDYIDQLHLIIKIIGTPSQEDIEYIAHAKAKQYVRSLPPSQGTKLSDLFPHAPALALDLLGRMLAFAPHKRITVEEALAHPFLASMRDNPDDPSEEPVCASPLNEDFEKHVLQSVEQAKLALWQEICEANGSSVPLQREQPQMQMPLAQDQGAVGMDMDDDGDMAMDGFLIPQQQQQQQQQAPQVQAQQQPQQQLPMLGQLDSVFMMDGPMDADLDLNMGMGMGFDDHVTSAAFDIEQFVGMGDDDLVMRDD